MKCKYPLAVDALVAQFAADEIPARILVIEPDADLDRLGALVQAALYEQGHLFLVVTRAEVTYH